MVSVILMSIETLCPVHAHKIPYPQIQQKIVQTELLNEQKRNYDLKNTEKSNRPERDTSICSGLCVIKVRVSLRIAPFRTGIYGIAWVLMGVNTCKRALTRAWSYPQAYRG